MEHIRYKISKCKEDRRIFIHAKKVENWPLVWPSTLQLHSKIWSTAYDMHVKGMTQLQARNFFVTACYSYIFLQFPRDEIFYKGNKKWRGKNKKGSKNMKEIKIQKGWAIFKDGIWEIGRCFIVACYNPHGKGS